jgi:hypothetical protein
LVVLADGCLVDVSEVRENQPLLRGVRTKRPFSYH